MTFEYRKEIEFVRIVEFLSYGFIIAGLFSLTEYFSPVLKNKMVDILAIGALKDMRFTALFDHPNDLATNCVILMSAICVLKYKNLISDLKFLLHFTAIFILGYLSISRVFILSAGLLIVLFVILYLVKNKKQGIKLILILGGILLLVALVFLRQTGLILVRMDILPLKIFGVEYDAPEVFVGDENWYNQVLAGEVAHDPGRIGIFKMYLESWSENISSILFGKGISAKPVGQISAHNVFLQLL